jgi:hypothetical protein
MHDLDGNGQWDENEVRILFRKELEKAYDPNNPEDDMKEREEEMERMREHVFRSLGPSQRTYNHTRASQLFNIKIG